MIPDVTALLAARTRPITARGLIREVSAEVVALFGGVAGTFRTGSGGRCSSRRALALAWLVLACSSTAEPQPARSSGASGAGTSGDAASGVGGSSSVAGSLTAGTGGSAAVLGGTAGGARGGAGAAGPTGATGSGGVDTAGSAGAGGMAAGATLPEKAYVYVGGGQNGQGAVALYSLDYASGALTLLKSLSVGQNCSFLTLDPENRALYATDDGGKRVRRLSLAPTTWEPALASDQPSSGSPVHVAVTGDGTLVLTAQWLQGTIEAFSVSGGMLGASLGSQAACGKAHEVVLTPQQDYVFVPCQTEGKLLRYQLDRMSGALTNPTSTPTASGAGPRHLAFAANGHFAYLVNELDGTVYAYAYSAGALTELQRITALPGGFSGSNASAEIAVAPSGRDVYASNRPNGQDGTIAQFRVGADGKLGANGHQSTGGRTPRSFAIDPTGRFLIAGNVDSSSLAVLRIDEATGKLDAPTLMKVAFNPWSVAILVP